MIININLEKMSDADLEKLRVSLIDLHNSLLAPESITPAITSALEDIFTEYEIRMNSFKD